MPRSAVGESLRDGRRAGPIDEGVELVLQMPARDRDAMRGHAPPLMSVAHTRWAIE